jgi:hypothetical protein
VLFEGLAAGDYTLTAGDASVALTVAEGGEEGQVVYIPVVESASLPVVRTACHR